jgi:hypothetical protein
MAIASALMGAMVAAHSQQLAKSGSIEFHTGWKYTVDAMSPAEKYVIGRGNATGVTFNNKGSGPLHLGPANCSEGFFASDGRGKGAGFCAFGDADGDRIFTQFTGTFGPDGATGINEITGGHR